MHATNGQGWARRFLARFLALAMVFQWFGGLSSNTVKAREGVPADPPVTFTKVAERVPGKVNTWKITLRAEFEPYLARIVNPRGQDIYIMLDRSKSMDKNVGDSGKTRMDFAKKAAKQFVGDILDQDKNIQNRVALTTFGSFVEPRAELTDMGGVDVLRAKIDKIDFLASDSYVGGSGGTFTQGVLRYTYDQAKVEAAVSPERPKMFILISDGEPTFGSRLKTDAEDAWQDDKKVYFTYTNTKGAGRDYYGDEVGNTYTPPAYTLKVTNTNVPYEQMDLDTYRVVTKTGKMYGPYKEIHYDGQVGWGLLHRDEISPIHYYAYKPPVSDYASDFTHAYDMAAHLYV